MVLLDGGFMMMLMGDGAPNRFGLGDAAMKLEANEACKPGTNRGGGAGTGGWSGWWAVAAAAAPAAGRTATSSIEAIEDLDCCTSALVCSTKKSGTPDDAALSALMRTAVDALLAFSGDPGPSCGMARAMLVLCRDDLEMPLTGTA